MERQRDLQLMEEYDRLQEEAEMKRQSEKEARDRRIQMFMDRMGDVVRKADDGEREMERKILMA
jgi:DNA-binding protein H-NS